MPSVSLVRAALPVLAGLWAGLILGVSFIATPVKFTAPLIDLNEALDLGRVTFGLFGPIELGIAAALGLLVFGGRWGVLQRTVAGGCFAVTLAENLWLRPLLDERLGDILAGIAVEPANYHLIYVVTQALKVVALVALSALSVAKISVPR